MSNRKIRTYPPIIVSLIAAATFFTVAAGQINSNAERMAETRITEIQSRAKGVQPEALTTFEDTAPKVEEATESSLIASRDWSAEENLMLMKIAMAEAEGEPVEGKALVMLVVLNRTLSNEFPDTIEDVIFQPGQFSPVTENGRYYTTEPNGECKEALEMVMKGWDESDGALYFESCENSSWHSQNLEFLFQVGNHKFYR